MASPTQWKVTVTARGKTRLIAQFENSTDAINYAHDKGRAAYLQGLASPHTWAVRYGTSSAPWAWKCAGGPEQNSFYSAPWRDVQWQS